MKKVIPSLVLPLFAVASLLFTGCDLDSSSSSSADVSGGGGSASNDINPSNVVFLDADVSSWAQTATLNASVSGGSVSLSYDMATQWPSARTRARDGGSINANAWVVVNVDGTWYAATFDWLKTGQQAKATSAVTGANGHISHPPLNNFRPRSGETYGFMVSTPARSADRTINERSNISTVVWP
ncbi:MAG: hypothetical protein JJU05_05200 [Verrucomicrobia bacterium]|nr:hypothetical protein [Verrucomicrobiota bacterium]MCH8525808.1 hypothetical protein [Kiritimatiellia bacterium]